MDSVTAFFAIVGVIIAVICVLFAVAGFAAFLANGGGLILIGLVIIAIGLILIEGAPGVGGGFGILLSLIGIGFIWGGVSSLKENN